MPAVTVDSVGERHVIGDLVARVFHVTGNSGDTLDTGMPTAVFATMMQDYVSIGISGSTLTLNTFAVMANAPVFVIAKSG